MKTIEQIARDVCASEGYECDAHIMQYTPTVGAMGHAVVHGDLIAQWQAYEPVIKAVITMLLDYGPNDDTAFKTFVADVLRGEAEMPHDPSPEETIERNWRVFYGLKR